MSRKIRQRAYTNILEGLVKLQKENPETFIETFVIYNYFKGFMVLSVLIWLFHKGLLFLFIILNERIIEIAQEYKLLIVFILIFLGIGLYIFREYSKFYYGLLEIAFGCVLIYISIDQINIIKIQAYPTIGAALYILVRGLDNTVQGYKAKKDFYINEMKD